MKPGEARLLDRRWWRKLWWVLDQVESENVVRLAEMEHRVHAGAMDYKAGGDCFRVHWDQALALQSKVGRELFPWLPADDPVDAARKMTADWEKNFGRLDDPETQRKVRATVEFLHSQAAKAREQNPLARR